MTDSYLPPEVDPGTPPENYTDITDGGRVGENPNTPRMNNFRALTSAIAMGKMEAGDPTMEDIANRFVQYKGEAERDPGYNNIKQMVLDARANKDTEGMKALMESYINNLSTDKAKDMAVGMGGIIREIQDSRKDVGSYHSAVVDSINPSLDELNHQHLVVQQKLAETVDDLLKMNKSWGDKFTNYGGLLLKGLVYPIMSDDIADFTKSHILTPGTSEKFFEYWASLPPDQKLASIPELKARALEVANNNPVRAASLLERFMSPGGAEKIPKDTWLEVGNVAAVVVTPAMISKSLGVMKRATNAVSFLRDAGAVDKAAQLNAKVLSDSTGKIGDAANVARQDAATNALPWAESHLSPEVHTENIAGQTMEELRHQEAQLAKFTRGTNPLVAEPLHDAEIQAAKEKYLGKWRTYADEPGSGFHGLTIKAVGEDGLEAEINFGARKTGDPIRTRAGADARLEELKATGVIEDGEVVEKSPGRFIIKSKDKYKWTKDDVGEMGGLTQGTGLVGSVQSKLATPSVIVTKMEGGKEMSQSVSAVTRSEYGSHVLSTTLGKAIATVLRPIGKVFLTPKARASLHKLDQVLIQGDAHVELNSANELVRGKVYSIDELKSGIETPAGKIKLSDKEISAYYGTRRVLDWLYMLENQTRRRAMVFRKLKWVDVEGVDAIGQPFETSGSAFASIQNKGVEKLYDPTAGGGLGRIVNRTDVNMEEMYKKGYKLVKLEEAQQLHGMPFDYVFVRNSGVKELPQRVLN